MLRLLKQEGIKISILKFSVSRSQIKTPNIYYTTPILLVLSSKSDE